MATTFQVSDILADVAEQTQSPPFAANTRVTLTRATYWLTQAVRALSALLRQHHYDDREMLQTQDLVTVPSLGMVSLPANCGEVHAVLWQRGTEDYTLIRTAQKDDLTQLVPRAWKDSDPCCRLEGETLGLYPPPLEVNNLKVYYTTHMASSGLGASIQSRLDADRWLTLDVATKVMIAKGKSPAQFEQSKALLENDFLNAMRERDEEAVHTIRDTRFERARSEYRRRWGG